MENKQNSTETIKQKIVKIFEAKTNRKKHFEAVLGELYTKLEPIFSKKEIFRNCRECGWCLNKRSNEKGILIGNLVFSDGGCSHMSIIGQYDEEGQLNAVAWSSRNNWEMADEVNYSLLKSNLNDFFVYDVISVFISF
ncbi:TPA_asm: hypothetical protein [Altiarchaeum virus]|nr:TPA_asm: hypothetical protein [Altiarchaeum virus]